MSKIKNLNEEKSTAARTVANEKAATRAKEKPCYVYAHHYDDTGEVFYIGCGTNLRAFSSCRHQSWKEVTEKHTWYVTILHKDLSETESLALEVSEITKVKENPNHKLVNKTDGGKGIKGMKYAPGTHPMIGHIVTEETRKKLSDKRQGFTYSAASKQKMSDSHKGVKLEEVTVEKMKEVLKRRRNYYLGTSISDSSTIMFLGQTLLKEAGYTVSSVWSVQKGKTKSYKGYKWRYATMQDLKDRGMDDFYNTAEYKEKYGLRPMSEIEATLAQIAEEFKAKENNNSK
jgi:hypothetical protein